MFLNEKEGVLIGRFLEQIDRYDTEEMTLVWNSGATIRAKFDTCFEDENDFSEEEPGYEEFTTFAFEVVEVLGVAPVLITEDNFFCVNYHNFPDEVLVDGTKIN